MTGGGDMTRLVRRYDAASTPLTSRQETDATRAVCRGLAEYLGQLSIDWPGSGLLRFEKATDVWADYEDAVNLYPRCFAGTAGAEGSYDGGLGQSEQTSGEVLGGGDLEAGGGVILDSFEELVVPVTVEIQCSNPEQRTGVVAMVERAMRPYRGRSGFMLELPHYFNVRSSHAAMRVTLMDSEEDAGRNYRLARVVVQSRVPVIVAHPVKPAKRIDRTSEIIEKTVAQLGPPPTVSVGKM